MAYKLTQEEIEIVESAKVMTDPAVTETVIEQGKALVRAIEVMGTSTPSRLRRRIMWRLLATSILIVGWQITCPISVNKEER